MIFIFKKRLENSLTILQWRPTFPSTLHLYYNIAYALYQGIVLFCFIYVISHSNIQTACLFICQECGNNYLIAGWFDKPMCIFITSKCALNSCSYGGFCSRIWRQQLGTTYIIEQFSKYMTKATLSSWAWYVLMLVSNPLLHTDQINA